MDLNEAAKLGHTVREVYAKLREANYIRVVVGDIEENAVYLVHPEFAEAVQMAAKHRHLKETQRYLQALPVGIVFITE